jgi:crotonobetainyl-CoA:carnitine CoA-transferase CaiB-like acyl-CoA transferase
LQELAADPRLSTNVKRVGEREWLIPALKQVIASRPVAEVSMRLERAQCSWAPVGKPADLFEDAHLMATGGLIETFLSRAGGEQGKPVKLPAMPFALHDDQRLGLRRHAPTMGQHNAEVLAEAGYSAAEIAALAEKKVIVAG